MPTALTYLYTSRSDIEDVLSSLGVSLRLDHQQAMQRVTVAGTPTAGTYTLSYGSDTTDAIAYNAPEADVQAALRLIPDLSAVVVNSSGTSPDFRHVVTMTGVSDVPVTLMTAGTGSLTGGTVTVSTILAASDSAITRVLNEVTAFCNKYLKAYKPYVGTNGATLADNWDINRIATDLGVCRCSMYLGNPIPQIFKARCDAAIADLISYLDGTADIPGILITNPVGAVQMVNIYRSGGMRVVLDPNKLDDVYRALTAAIEGEDTVLLDSTLNYNTTP